jgi:hypothetical protein
MSQTVRAKFRTWSNNGRVVVLNPVMDGSEENKAFWDATPGGSISLSITNPDALEKFIPGEECYVDFTFIKKVVN